MRRTHFLATLLILALALLPLAPGQNAGTADAAAMAAAMAMGEDGGCEDCGTAPADDGACAAACLSAAMAPAIIADADRPLGTAGTVCGSPPKEAAVRGCVLAPDPAPPKPSRTS